MGYASRAGLPAPDTVLLPIHARALALGADPNAAVLLTVDNCILPAAVTETVRTRLSQRLQLPPDRVAITVTHTHSAPCLTGAAPNIFAADIAAEDQEAVDAYTRFFTDRLEEAAATALQNRQPARLAWGQGTVGFAKNRRTAGGPVDHDLPLLRVSSPEGRLRAVLVSYACHCTTLGGDLNATHGDWAGVAAAALERAHPDAIALVAIGCGADANPDPRGSLELVQQHGESLASEAARLLDLPLTPITATPICRLRTLALPFQPHFTRTDWEQRAAQSGIVGYHARKWLARLDRGEPLPESLPYPVQTWAFGDQLAMVFLGGEVVVDYALRLKQELDASRIWINAYANDVPCYIPSRRILAEGGYEAESSLWYYDRPQRLSPEIEDLIVSTVLDLLPTAFRADPRQARLPPPLPLPATLNAFRTRPGLRVELVAAEPLVDAPVAVDFGADGRVWVCEMRDYPSGLDGEGRPGGRISVLHDSDGDGRPDTAERIAEGLPFPTGLMSWRDGVLVCAAPDVWWIAPAKSSASPGPDAGTVQPRPGWTATRLLTGFATHNFQARVNGLRWGLDGWVYGSGSLFGGTITNLRSGAVVDCRNRDFRFDPDTGHLEALAGVSQQGRIRDDFDEWFGNDNGALLWHFPLPDRYSRRSPHAGPPGTRRVLPGEADIGRVYPASRTLERFNDPHTANHLTSACGPEIYRDSLLGDAFAGNGFVCEPVHNLVRRALVEPDGVSFRTRRAPGESASEFLSTTDHWFRPVEVRTGPDGALWVVDMHRFVVEHPRWIPEDRLAELDVRAGAGTGRLWRVVPQNAPPRPVRNLTSLDPTALAEVLASPNGVERDLAHRLLILSQASSDPSARDAVRRIAGPDFPTPMRAQALAVLSRWEALPENWLADALRSEDPRLRRFAIRLAEAGADPAAVPEPLLLSVEDPDPGVRFQLALTLGEFHDPAAGAALARLAARDAADPWARAAILSSVLASPESFATTLAGMATSDALAALRRPALDSLIAAERTQAVTRWLVAAFPPERDLSPEATSEALHLLAALTSRPQMVQDLAANPDAAAAMATLEARFGESAAAFIPDASQPESVRLAAATLLGESARVREDRREELLGMLGLELPSAIRGAVLSALRRQETPAVALRILEGWPDRSPGHRAELIGVLLAREAWADVLLSAVEDGRVQGAELSPAQRERLRQSPEVARANRATQLLPPADSDRSQVLDRFAPAAHRAGDPHAGAALFERLCASCHLLRGVGHGVGPDLAAFRSKSGTDFLVAILDPNAAIEPRYAAWTVETQDGRSFTGVVRDETSTHLTVVQPGGTREAIARANVARLFPSDRSLMPEGLEDGLEPGQLADLIAWIRQAPRNFGEATAGQLAAARERFRELAGSPATLESNTAPLTYPSWLGSLPMHYCRATDGNSRVRWQVPAGPGPWRLPAATGFASQPPGRFTLLVNSRPALEFDVSLEDARWTSADSGVVVTYRVEESSAEDSNGLLEIHAVPGWATADAPITFEVRGSPSGSQRWFGVYDARDIAAKTEGR